ncbi:MAG TPA: carbohydrate ABC transporter permease [Allosphingosinicella sp.]|jgi:multiple sugar transport system permease protein
MSGRLARLVAAWLIFAGVGPYLWMTFQAFRDRGDITASPPTLHLALTFQNFAWEYNGQSILQLLINGLIISGGTVVLSLIIGAPSAYFFARFVTPWSRTLFLLVLSTRMAPPIALSLPMFALFTFLDIRGSYLSVILAQTAFNVSFVVWFLQSAVAESPREIELAAQIDGRSWLGALLDIVIPAHAPALQAASAFVFLFSWNEYLLSSLLSSSLTRPITPALPGFIAQATSQWGNFCAVALIASLPPICLVFMVRRFLARGFTSGIIHDGTRLA